MASLPSTGSGPRPALPSSPRKRGEDDAAFPSADQIATAIVLAARVHGEDPIAIPSRGQGANRGRALAYASLVEAFPQVMKAKFARWCGYPSQSSASAQLIYARKAKWWSEDALDEIVGELVADAFEDEAAELPPSSPHPELVEGRGEDGKARRSPEPVEGAEPPAAPGEGVGAESPLTKVGRPIADAPGADLSSPRGGEDGAPHFGPDERRLITRMHAGGADATAIAAALGAAADEVAAWLREHRS